MWCTHREVHIMGGAPWLVILDAAIGIQGKWESAPVHGVVESREADHHSSTEEHAEGKGRSAKILVDW